MQSATSPNCRSRSITSTFWCASASATARLQAVSVLPVPPFGPSTQMSRASPRWPFASALDGRRAIAFDITKRSCSFDCG